TSMTTAPPPAHYGAVKGALASGFATAELHHLWGVRHAKLIAACGWQVPSGQSHSGQAGTESCGHRGNARSEV
ncbi:hypothetical protein CN137_33940, partial [Sinorhizobium meliloti]